MTENSVLSRRRDVIHHEPWKRATLFSTVPLAFLERLLRFLYTSGSVNKYSTIMQYIYSLAWWHCVILHVAKLWLRQSYLQFKTLKTTTVDHFLQECVRPSTKPGVRNFQTKWFVVRLVQFLMKYFCQYSSKKYVTIPEIFDQIQSLFKMQHFLILRYSNF